MQHHQQQYHQFFQQRLFAAIDTRPSAKDLFENKIRPQLFFDNNVDDTHHDDQNQQQETQKFLDRFNTITTEFNKALQKVSSSSSSSFGTSLPPLLDLNNNGTTTFSRNITQSIMNDSHKSEFVKVFAEMYFSLIYYKDESSSSSSSSPSSISHHHLPALSDILLSLPSERKKKNHDESSSSSSSTTVILTPTPNHIKLFTKHANLLMDCFEERNSGDITATFEDASSTSTSSTSLASKLSILSSFADFLRISTISISDPWIRSQSWAKTLETRMQSKVEDLLCGGDPFDYCEHYQTLMDWKRQVAEPFVRTLLLGNNNTDILTTQQNKQQQQQQQTTNDQVDQWMTFCNEYLCRAVAKTRLDSIFDIIVDFPDSKPHLLDIASCVAQQPSLLRDVARMTKSAITNRLQHAGASTANVLFLLSQTCRALCVIRPGKAAGEALIRQVCDTTIRHLRARKDSVTAVVGAITESSSSSSQHAWARTSSDASLDDTTTNNSNNTNHKNFSGPDILRMLLSVLTVPVIVKEYCRTLSERLLNRKPHQVDIDAEKEVLERLKVLLGEDALSSNAAVMLKDFETSRRWMKSTVAAAKARSGAAQNNNNNNNTGSSSLLLLANDTASANVVSAPCWPSNVGDEEECTIPFNEGLLGSSSKQEDTSTSGKNFRLHPSLQEYHRQISEEFHKWKQNQSLRLLPHLGFVDLSVTQHIKGSSSSSKNNHTSDRNGANNNNVNHNDNDDDVAQQTIRKTFRLNLIAASVVLYLQEEQKKQSTTTSTSSSSISLEEMATKKLNIPVSILAQHIQEYTPQLFVIKKENTKNNNNNSSTIVVIQMQKTALSSRDLMDQQGENGGSGGDGQNNDDDGDENNNTGSGGGASGSSLLQQSTAASGPVLPSSITQGAADRLEQMLKTMIPNTGPKSASQIENSARMFGIFSGSSNDMRDVLSYFLQKNVICTDGSGIYRLPAAE